VTTFVQQLDTQGPAVVQRISTQVGDLACSQDTIENLVDALHSGKSVTIASNVNGQSQSATFNASGAHLGYGEAYIALSLAAQQLRNAGVTSCATPEQWQAVLLGGPLITSVTSSGTNSYASAGGSTQLPGIVTLHTQGQGWGQIAQSSNLQLNQVVSNANVSSNATNASSTNESANSPTGFSSSQMNQGRFDSDTNSGQTTTKPEKKHHWWSRDKDSDKTNNSQTPAPDSSSTSGAQNTQSTPSSSSQSNPTK
jgi:hypothetical protein